MRPNGSRPTASAVIAPRVSRKRPSAGWYGSVAVPMATGSCLQDATRELAASTSTMFGLTRIEAP